MRGLGVLGAPGIFVAAPRPVRRLAGVRRNVAAFAGVAPRGPARLPDTTTLEADIEVATWIASAHVRRTVPIAVTSWGEYQNRFGAYEGPGRLPYAVAAFFAGGGRTAVVTRIVHDGPPAAGCATGHLDGLETTASDPIELRAHDEGRWGNALRVTMRFDTRPLRVHQATATGLVVDLAEWVPVGSLLRLRMPDDSIALAYVDDSVEHPELFGPVVHRDLTLAGGLVQAPEVVEVVTARLTVVDHDPAAPRREELADLGLRADHPRWLARQIITESRLVWPAHAWVAGTIRTADVRLAPVALVAPDAQGDTVDHMTGGVDRWDSIVADDFFDPAWVPGDEVPGDGIHALAERTDVGLLLAPDLYDPAPLADDDDVGDPPTLCGPDFAEHVETDPPPPPAPVLPGLDGLRRNPLVAGEYDDIVAAQRRLIEYAEQRRDLTVLLDVPLGLPQRGILDWRNEFDSSFAAAYHPWLDVAGSTGGDRTRGGLVRVNPSAFAAAIIAERELRLGVQHGPANQIAVGAVRVADAVTPDHHDTLHVNGVDVFVPDPDGIRLTGARTLSRRPSLRQLSVARLMIVLRLTLEREMRWVVFEPNDPALWAEVRRLVHDLLTGFYEAGAFRGATTQDAFFVRCDETTMTRNDLDQGRLVCLVGVHPAEPIEYIVLDIAVTAVTVRVEVAS